MKFVPNAVSLRVGRTLLETQKNSPTILFAAGVVGAVGAVALACRATLKVDEILNQSLKDQRILESMTAEDYSDKEREKDLVHLKVQTLVKVGKEFAPPAILLAASIAALSGSHHILTKRNAALTAAYAGLERSYNEYRKRVADRWGEEAEREIRFQPELCEIEEEGKTKKVKLATQGPSVYARFFGRDNRNWEPTPEYNLLFIKCQQNYLNDKLKSRGHVFLNEAYDALGMERSQEGAVVGWLWDGNGDQFVDFGIFDGNELTIYDFVTGREGVWLDFNVDGVIYDKI